MGQLVDEMMASALVLDMKMIIAIVGAALMHSEKKQG